MGLTFYPFSDFALVIGNKAGGKTTFTKWMCKQLDRILVLDPTWQLGELGYVVHNIKLLAAAFQRFKKVVFQPSGESDAIYIEFFKIARQFQNYTLVIDEIDQYLGSKKIICEDAKIIAVRGRAQGIGIIGNSRRPQDFNKCVRTQGDHVITFSMVDDDDLHYVSKWIGKTKEQIKELKQYWSFYYDVRGKTTTLQKPLRV